MDGTPPPRAGTPDYFNYNDTYGHGTHTAGIIAGVGNNRQGIAGVNWSVKLLVCRFIWNDGSGYVSDAMNCIKLCKQEGALITSNSWGGIGYSSAWAGSRRRRAMGHLLGLAYVFATGSCRQSFVAAMPSNAAVVCPLPHAAAARHCATCCRLP